ncbi:hypothetical protein ACFFJY_09350 [Fictibacillus aquaticus]|nr:hypothetical protein [Fictibacillus aquaticus]
MARVHSHPSQSKEDQKHRQEFVELIKPKEDQKEQAKYETDIEQLQRLRAAQPL